MATAAVSRRLHARAFAFPNRPARSTGSGAAAGTPGTRGARRWAGGRQGSLDCRLGVHFGLCDELEPHAGKRADVDRFLRPVAERLADFLDPLRQRVLGNGRVRPYGIEQLLLGEGAASLTHEEREDLERLRRQRHGCLAAHHAERRGIEHERAEFVPHVCRHVAPPMRTRPWYGGRPGGSTDLGSAVLRGIRGYQRIITAVSAPCHDSARVAA